jgi:hypothetical protein
MGVGIHDAENHCPYRKPLPAHHSSRSTRVTVLHAPFLAREITIRQPHVEFRKVVVEKAGLGFKLPPQKGGVGPNGPKWTETPDVQLAVSV